MILVTGATGTVGRALVRHLSERGAAFKAMVRKEAARDAEGTGVAAVGADYTDPARLSEAMNGVSSRSTSSVRPIPHISRRKAPSSPRPARRVSAGS